MELSKRLSNWLKENLGGKKVTEQIGAEVSSPPSAEPPAWPSEIHIPQAFEASWQGPLETMASNLPFFSTVEWAQTSLNRTDKSQRIAFNENKTRGRIYVEKSKITEVFNFLNSVLASNNLQYCWEGQTPFDHETATYGFIPDELHISVVDTERPNLISSYLPTELTFSYKNGIIREVSLERTDTAQNGDIATRTVSIVLGDESNIIRENKRIDRNTGRDGQEDEEAFIEYIYSLPATTDPNYLNTWRRKGLRWIAGASFQEYIGSYPFIQDETIYPLNIITQYLPPDQELFDVYPIIIESARREQITARLNERASRKDWKGYGEAADQMVRFLSLPACIEVCASQIDEEETQMKGEDFTKYDILFSGLATAASQHEKTLKILHLDEQESELVKRMYNWLTANFDQCKNNSEKSHIFKWFSNLCNIDGLRSEATEIVARILSRDTEKGRMLGFYLIENSFTFDEAVSLIHTALAKEGSNFSITDVRRMIRAIGYSSSREPQEYSRDELTSLVMKLTGATLKAIEKALQVSRTGSDKGNAAKQLHYLWNLSDELRSRSRSLPEPFRQSVELINGCLEQIFKIGNRPDSGAGGS